MTISTSSVPRFTVFTPAYNRAHTLHRVYASLRSQTFRDFEWIVIDDGSVDDTAALIGKWQQVAEFPIAYHYQENIGKHVAFNRGVELARGEFFLVIDSDDSFLPHSLETMLQWWENIAEEQRADYTGVVTLCQYEDGHICGQPFPQNPLDTDALALRFRYKMRSETWGFHRTLVLKDFPFPENPEVRFIPENIVWDKIARHYKIRCINEPLRIFYQDAGNQVTKADPRKKALVKDYFLEILNRDFDYFPRDPLSFVKWATLYIRYSLHRNDWFFINPLRFSDAGAFALCCLAVFPGMLMYMGDTMKRMLGK